MYQSVGLNHSRTRRTGRRVKQPSASTKCRATFPWLRLKNKENSRYEALILGRIATLASLAMVAGDSKRALDCGDLCCRSGKRSICFPSVDVGNDRSGLALLSLLVTTRCVDF